MVSILLVEDNDSLARLYTISLTTDGYTVIHASSCQEANQLLVEAEPDIAILDMNLPDGSGLSIAELIRATPQLKAIPILVITANEPQPEAIEQFQIDRVLRKPVSLPFLSALIKQIATPRLSGREKISIRAKR